MTRAHYRKQPGGRTFHRRVAGPNRATEQATLRGGGNRRVKQKTIDKWDAGVEEVDREFAKMRSVRHLYEALGAGMPACKHCALDELAQIHRRFG